MKATRRDEIRAIAGIAALVIAGIAFWVSLLGALA